MKKPSPSTPSEIPDPNVEDPHSGSVSDGTHPEANESKPVRKEDGNTDRLKRKKAIHPAIMPRGDPSGAA